MDDFKVGVIDKDFNVREITLPGSSQGGSAEYPSSWFRDNGAVKPPINTSLKPESVELWDKLLGYNLHTMVNPHIAVLFMIDYIMDNFIAVSTQDWKSYGVHIAGRGAHVTPMSLLSIKSGTNVIIGTEGPEITEMEKHRLFYILVAGYRYGLASEIIQGDYKATVLGKINQVLRNDPYNLESDLTPTELSRSKSWYNNLEFRKLIAALDMFWTKFPDSSGAKLRVCTLNSRFKDCSSISEIRHLSEVSGKKVGDILRYIFSARVGEEIMKIGKEGEEVNQEDSYFPYMRELGLSKRSPYSSTENVHLHNWISIFCALLGSERSFNARVVSENGLMISLNLAILAAYAFKTYSSPTIVFGTKEDAEEAKMLKEIDEEEGSTDCAFDPASPMGVYKHMSDNSNSIPPDVKQVFVTLLSKMAFTSVFLYSRPQSLLKVITEIFN
ncbi:PREDICTED: uncharacterized protein LOC107172489 [Diuraphis noxia]|uniref:uncharacterized protein LOC107172489 n=1 Tax=Diuraphis noxia TaxID=143948 RepID=UPI00076397CE|nr:PREDICTED: uncharacterized protein LOC107172489 [Diuraphis noxia]